MATKTVHRSNPGADIDQIVTSLNAVVDLANELKTLFDNHIASGKHVLASSVDAASPKTTKAAADKISLGY